MLKISESYIIGIDISDTDDTSVMSVSKFDGTKMTSIKTFTGKEAEMTVTVCHSHTKSLAYITHQADILVSAVGRPGFIHDWMVKPGAVVIDVGITRGSDGKLHGDVDFEDVEEIASHITPVPGGVGPMTRAMLMQNIWEVCHERS